MNDNLRNRYSEVTKRVWSCAEKSGRNPDDIKIIAVGKTFPIEVIREAYDSGIRIFGENKVQELVEKHNALDKDISWHMIGHLQKNKVKYIAEFIDLIHSVDSLGLAREINKQAHKNNRKVNVLVQVNMAKEESKFGINPEDTEKLLREISLLPSIKVKGLMAIGPHVKEESIIRDVFQEMYTLYIDIRRKKINNIDMEILSMGMSNDYEIAIQEGSNMIRIGSAIFGKRNYSNI